MAIYSFQEQPVPFRVFCRVGQNISSRTIFVLKSGLGEETRVKASWAIPFTYQANCCLLPPGRKEGVKEQGEEGRKQGCGARLLSKKQRTRIFHVCVVN